RGDQGPGRRSGGRAGADPVRLPHHQGHRPAPHLRADPGPGGAAGAAAGAAGEPEQAQHLAPGRGQEGEDHDQPAVRHVLEEPQRLRRRPAAAAVGDATAFDAVYDSSASFDEVYARIVEAIVDAATNCGEVLYAVPGSPLVAERTVELLRDDPRIAVEIVPGLSFLDLAWARLGVDPVASGARVVDGRRFAVEAAGDRGPLLIAQCDTRATLSDV